MDKDFAPIKDFLDEKVIKYNCPAFIEEDPISIPRLFTQREDIEISGFLTATIAWGQRKTILKNARMLMELMDMEPYNFVINAGKRELMKLNGFVHRTFNTDDLMFFIQALRNIYSKHNSMECIFSQNSTSYFHAYESICNFHRVFFETPHLKRSVKHVSNPANGSAAKRINMFLRWMVRNDNNGVDFGIWNTISPAHLQCPLDLHSGNVARKLGLLTRKQNDWKAVEELTNNLRQFDIEDPIKYDFALFGLGVNKEI